MTRGALALVLCVLFVPTAGAQISARATLEPPQLRVCEPGEFAVEVQGAQNVAVPTIPNVDPALNIRYVGPSTQVSIVNNQMTASVTHRFSVSPTRPGTFTIGPIT